MNKTQFIGRKKELQLIKTKVESRNSAIIVVYGRRRVGKSLLIDQAMNNYKALKFEGIENRSTTDQINNFLLQLNYQLKPEKPVHNTSNWREAFIYLFDQIKDRSTHLVFDEFQWMANYRKDIVSDLKMVWDQYLSQIPGLTLVLCGSIASFMLHKVIRSKALYGRTDLHIHLKPFNATETSLMLPDKGLKEVVEAHMFTGGIPKYLELLKTESSIYTSLNREAFTESGYYFQEFDRIFTSHFGRNPDFEKIIRTLAKHPYGMLRKELLNHAGISPGGNVTKHLFDLESADFIRSSIPIDKKTNFRHFKYTLTDAYMRFYFAFIEPARRKIIEGLSDTLFFRISQTPVFSDWKGRAFEYFCIQHAKRISEILGFNGIDFMFGPFFRSHTVKTAGVQIDLVYDRADNVITLCEMKYLNRPVGVSIIEDIEKKVQVLQEFYPEKTIQRVLVTLTPPSNDLINAGYLYRVITADEII